MIGHFGIHVPIVRFHAMNLVVFGECIKTRRRSSVALIPVVAWKGFVKFLRLSAGVVLNVTLGQIRLGLRIFWKVRSRYRMHSGNDVGVAVGVCLLASVFCL